MKKKLAVLLALTLSVTAMAACGNEGEASTESTAATEGTAAAESAASTESAVLAEATITPTVEVVEDASDLASLVIADYVTLGDYQNMTVSVTPLTEISDEELEAYVSYMLSSGLNVLTTEEFKTEGAVADGDVVLIDYEGKKDGVAFDGGTASGAMLGIGSGMFIDGFEEGLIGVLPGETVDLELTFPEGYSNSELVGKDVVFTVTVKGRADGEQYKTAVKEYVEGMNQYYYYSDVNDAICQELVNICTISKLPSGFYEDYKNVVIETLSKQADAYGMDADAYANMYVGMNLADYAVSAAESYTVQAMLFQAVANEEGLVPTDEEVDAFAEEYVSAYGENYGFDSIEAFYETNPIEEIRIVMLQDKVLSYLTEHATIVDAE